MIQVSNCPWGKPQSVQLIADGVVKISTASHGGLKLDRKRNALIPEYMRAKGGWYEEDDAIIIPTIVLKLYGTMNIAEEKAMAELRDRWPDEYEKFTGTTLKEGESKYRDAELWRKRNHGKYVVHSAFGDWNPKVPKGFVGVYAKLLQADPPPGKWFLVPKDFYESAVGGCAFDADKFEEIEAIQ